MDRGVRRWTHGPSFEEGGIRFRLWAPAEQRVSLALESRSSTIPMERRDGGFFEVFVEGIGAGALYRFELSDGTRVPDPASRYQPQDVHGPSETIDHEAYRWRERWPGRAWDDVVLYELHIGAFTPEGSFAAAARKLDHLVELGVTAVEIMPVADFRGRWGWGYDGVYLYAPDASYGRPEDFKAFVEAAHRRGVAVLLDVVYNHFGPEGNYLSSYAPDFFTSRHRTPWGEAINFDGPNARPVRDFVIENAEYWIDAFRLDGLRLDAVHSIKDDSRPDIVDELAARLRSRFARTIHLLLENENNEPQRLVRHERKPLLYTAQWNDDVHHVLHVAATHEKSGYYADYGDTKLLARALAEGFAYQGEISPYRGAPRGGPSAELPPGAFVAFIQNHDQIGNRAFGERLSALASAGGRPGARERLSPPAADADAVHGRGVGGGAAVPVLLRFRRRTGGSRPTRAAQGIRALSRVRRSRAGGEDSRSDRRSDIPVGEARLEPDRRRAPRLLPRRARRAAGACPAASAEDRARRRGRGSRRAGGPRRLAGRRRAA